MLSSRHRKALLLKNKDVVSMISEAYIDGFTRGQDSVFYLDDDKCSPNNAHSTALMSFSTYLDVLKSRYHDSRRRKV